MADAYSKGFSDGENSAKNELLDFIVQKASEKFVERANQVYLSAKSMANYLHGKGYKVEKIYINIFHKSPKVILSLKPEALLDDDFVVCTYTKINEMQCSFRSLFQSTLDLSLISITDLNDEMLAKDGFDYSEVP